MEDLSILEAKINIVMPSDMLRSFIAFELHDKETIERIKFFQGRLRKNQPRITLVWSENLHMTVKFLGDIKESIAPKIYEIIKNTNDKSFKGKQIEFKLVGAGEFRNYSVIWVKLEGDIKFLQKVKDTIDNLLNINLAIERDRRLQFEPHLTIARLRQNKIDYKTFDSLKNIIQENEGLEFGKFAISEIKLKKSELTPRGPIYSDLVY